MTITIDATYEDGVLKPAEPLPFSEHEKVRVTLEKPVVVGEECHAAASGDNERGELSALEKIIARANALPEEIVSQWPTDGASQHDHYIYGTPKRTDLCDKPE